MNLSPTNLCCCPFEGGISVVVYSLFVTIVVSIESVFCVVPLFSGVFFVLSCLTIIPLRTSEPVALLYCVVAVYILCLFLRVPWLGLRCVIIAVPGHNYYLNRNEGQY